MYAFAQDRDEAIRAWAKGIYPMMAGAELLIRSGWAERLDRSGYLKESDSREYAYPRVGDFLTASGYLSGGEFRQLTVIASFLGQLSRGTDSDEAVVKPYEAQLYEMLPGVDRPFIRLVMSAVGYAAGLHESGGGHPYPWDVSDG